MLRSDKNPIIETPSLSRRKKVRLRKGLIFTIVAFSLLMTTIDGTIVATALHTLQEDLHTSVNWAGWTLTAYAFGFVLMLPLSAKMSIQWGHKKVFLFSIIVFTAASLLCGLANDIYTLIAFRVIQSIGGAGITPSVTGIIVDHFGDSRDRAVGLFGSIFPIGAMIGPIFGGLFVTYWTWRGIFFVNLPLGLFVIFMGLKYIPKDLKKVQLQKDRPDYGGIALMALGIITAMFGASYLGEKDSKVFSFTFISLMVVSLVALWGFFRHINKSLSPFIKPLFIYGKGFGAVNLINLIFGGATNGVISLIPLYAVTRFGISELNSGTLLIAEGIAAVVLSTLFSFLLRRTGYHFPLYLGGSLAVAGTALLAFPPQLGMSPYLWLAAGTFLVGAGVGSMSPASRNAGLQLAPRESATLAALRSMGMQLGGIVSISVMTAILAESSNATEAHRFIHLGIAAILLLSLPLVVRVPQHKGAW